MIVLDTDHLTIIQRAGGAAYSRLAAKLDAVPRQEICVSIVTFEEQARGWLAHITRAKTLDRQVQAYARLRELLTDFQTRPILDFDDHAARAYQSLVRARIRIGTMDIRIASVALVHGATLLSRNLADFRKVPGLRVEDWTI